MPPFVDVQRVSRSVLDSLDIFTRSRSAHCPIPGCDLSYSPIYELHLCFRCPGPCEGFLQVLWRWNQCWFRGFRGWFYWCWWNPTKGLPNCSDSRPVCGLVGVGTSSLELVEVGHAFPYRFEPRVGQFSRLVTREEDSLHFVVSEVLHFLGPSRHQPFVTVSRVIREAWLNLLFIHFFWRCSPHEFPSISYDGVG